MIRRFVFSLVVIISLFSFSVLTPAQVDKWKNRTVISVLDGDTVVLDNGEVVRLIGVLAPRARHAKQEGEAYGDQARYLAEELLLGKQVDITFDAVYGASGHRDRDGRALGYVNVTKGIEKLIANAELLRVGAGFLATVPDDLQIAKTLKSSEEEARKKKAGVWTTTDKSPIEVANANGKTFQERAATVSLTTVRPTTPILEGPGLAAIATNQPAAATNTGRRVAVDMEDLRAVKERQRKEAQQTQQPTEKKVDLYKLKDRKGITSVYEGDQRLEVYQATLEDGDKDYRIGIKNDTKEAVLITDYQGLKNFNKLLSKATESQPTLTALENNVGSLSGRQGNISVSTGKDGGVVLNIGGGREGGTRLYLTRQNSLKLQIALDALP
jgi:endonuclease YncB( thermonuclease family)